MTLFHPHHAKRFGAIWGHVEFSTSFHDLSHQRVAVGCWHRNLERQFTAERNAEQSCTQTTTDGDIGAGHEREGVIADVLIYNLFQQFPAVGPRDSVLRPSFSGRNQLHVHVGKQTLANEFHVAIDGQGIGGCGCDDEMILRQSPRRAIIQRNSVFAQHQPVTDLADGELCEPVAVNLVKEIGAVHTLHINFAQGRDIAHADGTARRENLTINTFTPMALTLFGEPLRPHPVADLNKHCALFCSPSMAWRQSFWVEILPTMSSCQHTNRGGRIGGAEDRGADLRDRLARQFRHNRKPAHIGRLALIGCHAQRGVAFQVFDRSKPFLVA